MANKLIVKGKKKAVSKKIAPKKVSSKKVITKKAPIKKKSNTQLKTAKKAKAVASNKLKNKKPVSKKVLNKKASVKKKPALKTKNKIKASKKMADKKIIKKAKTKELSSGFTFFKYLHLFYLSNRKEIRKVYQPISRKFLDHNDPSNANAFLRKPQFEALEMYIFLKEYLGNQHIQEVFTNWYKKENQFKGREGLTLNNATGQLGIFDAIEDKIFKEVADSLEKQKTEYANYIFALTMGLGKTILMGTCIFYEFLLANKYPKSKLYCHNALVLAPDKTVLHSLEEIKTFDKSRVIPPEHLNWLESNIQFHYLSETDTTLNIIEKSRYNVIISNGQKIILKKKHKDPSKAQLFFDGTESVYKAKSLNTDYADLLDFDKEIDINENQRFRKLTRLEQIGVYIDEAHHAFGTSLEKSLTSLKFTINELHSTLKETGSEVVACYNYTGTPYVQNKILPEVVYAYGLKEAIENKYLKKVNIEGYENTKTQDFLNIAITDFWKRYNGKKYENLLPKIALFASNIAELEKDLKPALQNVLTKLGIPHSKILVNVGDDSITSANDIREFRNLDKISSDKQFILLVNKGKEGWNCRSLFGVAMFREPKSKIFVLQATMRCLRAITDIQQEARVYLSESNKELLDAELRENFNMSVEDLNKFNTSDDKKDYQSYLKKDIKLKLVRIQKRFELKEKSIKAGLDLEIENAPINQYRILRSEYNITSLSTRLRSVEDLTHLKERVDFSPFTLVAEIARYLRKNPIELEEVLESTTQGMFKILKYVNEHNELLYDWIIPRLFAEYYDLKEFESKEEHDIHLVKTPELGYYTLHAKPDLVVTDATHDAVKFKDKSFNLDKYCFDSKPERNFFWHLLKSAAIKEVYFTGMLTNGQSDFFINYIDPISHTVRSYYPDFLVKNSDDSWTVYEIKADNMIEDDVVQAKAQYATANLAASKINYAIIESSKFSD